MCLVNAGFSRNPLLQIGWELDCGWMGVGGVNTGVNPGVNRCERTCVSSDVLG